jgi:hypothetical protein
VKSRRTLGSRGDHLDLRVVDETGHEQRVIWWFGDLDAVPPGHFDLAYTVRPNVFNGKREALIEWLDARPVAGEALLKIEPRYDVVDYRQAPNPQAALEQVRRDDPEAVVWSEGVTLADGLNRYQLRGAAALVVWTVPPDPVIWQSALDIVQPQTLVLFGQRAPFDQADALLKHVAGLLKYAQTHKGSEASVSELAALTGQTEATLTACLRWLHQHTAMQLTLLSEDVVRIETRDTPPETADRRTAEQLQVHLAETQAYRRYWLQQRF